MGPSDPNAPWGWVPPEWLNPAPGPSADPYWDPNEPQAPPILNPEPLHPATAAHGTVPDPIADVLARQYNSISPEGADRLAARLRERAGVYTGTPPSGTTRDGIERANALSGLTKDDVVWAQGIGRIDPTAHPRTDNARIAQATGPIGTVGQIGKDVDPNAPQQAPIGDLPTFSPEELAMVGQPRLSPEEEAQIEIDPQGGAAPALPPDAISGGMVPGQELPTGQTTGAPQMPDEYLSPEELGQKWADLPLEEQEKRRSEIEGARDTFARARMVDESARALKQAEQNARDYETAIKASQQKTAELDLEAQRLAQRNPLDDIGVGQKVAGALSAVLGGFLGNTGGIDTIDKLIANATAGQARRVQALGMQRDLLSDHVARTGDLYQAQKAVQLAAWDATIKKLETDVQSFDPRGTQALKYMDTINQARAKRAEVLAKYQTEQQKAIENALKEERERAKLLEEQRHNKAQERNEATRAGADWIKAKAEVKKTEKELAGNGAKERKAEADAVKAEAEAEAAQGGFYVRHPETGKPLTGEGGKPVAIMDQGRRDRTDKMIAAAKNIRLAADRLAALRKKSGGHWEALGSEEAQDARNIAAMIDFETYKAFDLGAPSAGDKAMAENARGGVELGSFVKDASKGLNTYAEEVERKMNVQLHQMGIEPIHLARRSDVEKAEPSVLDTVAGRLATAPDHDISIGGGIGGVNVDPARVEAMGGTVPKSSEVRAVENDLTILASYAEQPNTAAEARAKLDELARNAVSGRVRDRAAEILRGLPGADERKEGAR